jgi:uncharacterized membrane protein
MSNHGIKIVRRTMIVVLLFVLLVVDFFAIYGTYYSYFVTSMPSPDNQRATLAFMIISLVVTAVYIYLILRRYQFISRTQHKDEVR